MEDVVKDAEQPHTMIYDGHVTSWKAKLSVFNYLKKNLKTDVVCRVERADKDENVYTNIFYSFFILFKTQLKYSQQTVGQRKKKISVR